MFGIPWDLALCVDGDARSGAEEEIGCRRVVKGHWRAGVAERWQEEQVQRPRRRRRRGEGGGITGLVEVRRGLRG